jgi:hypothetical protein
MENQEQEVAAQPRKMIHLQVAGTHTQEELATLIAEFQKTWADNGIIATPANVVATLIQSTEDLSGLILTPKATYLEVAAGVVSILRAFDVGQGNEPSPLFFELDQDAQREVLGRIQCVMRFGGLPPSDGNVTEKTRDLIFVESVRALGSNLTAPNGQNSINVVRVAQKEGDEDKEVRFHELVAADIFKHNDQKFIALSDPYVNWVAHPLPVITIDAEVYAAPEPVAPEDVKSCETSEKKVQSKPSKSKAKNRKQ